MARFAAIRDTEVGEGRVESGDVRNGRPRQRDPVREVAVGVAHQVDRFRCVRDGSSPGNAHWRANLAAHFSIAA